MSAMCPDPGCWCCNPARHDCHGPEGANAGDQWTCDECGRTWTAFDPHTETYYPQRMLKHVPVGTIGWRSPMTSED